LVEINGAWEKGDLGLLMIVLPEPEPEECLTRREFLGLGKIVGGESSGELDWLRYAFRHMPYPRHGQKKPSTS
jgi:hypothetical protein